ncbi:MAG TPA: type II CAAX endopeptidase family protein [Kofleriaceae bacterium]|nr:type II CAAX endopeptidase family protein [Kofleriaceae bacterium]
MGGPIGFGVFQALDAQRRKAGGSGGAPRAPGQGWWYFILATLCLSWLTAGLIGRPPLHAGAPMASRLLWASLFYAATMGWQPIVAAWLAKRWRDRPTALNGGLRWPPLRDVGLALAVAGGLAAAAMLVARLFGEPPQPALTIALDAGSALAATGALAVLCLQAVTEEYGWRGTPLTYAIERWGVRAGLIVHGLLWGAWYAPLFLLTSPTPLASLTSAGGFALTCLLLGIVLGWLRLRSRSIAPPAIANALLTIVAGLPLLLQDGSSGARDAVFRWPGWPVIGIAALVVLVLRGRDLGTAPAAR